MNITKVERVIKDKVPLSDAILCVIDGVECWVPPDMNNKDYTEIKKQELAGKLVIQDKIIE